MTFPEWWRNNRDTVELYSPYEIAFCVWRACRDHLRDELRDRDAEIEKLTRRVAELERPVNPPDPPEPRRRDIRREFAALQILCAYIASDKWNASIREADTIAREFLEYMDKEVHND